MGYLWLEKKVGAGNAVFAVFLLVMLILWAINSLWSGIGKTYWKSLAQTASAAAETAQTNAESADKGAGNASQTRRNSDGQTAAARREAEESAQRIDDYANPEPAGDDRLPPDDGIVRELEAAEDQARAAADRLQRAGIR